MATRARAASGGYPRGEETKQRIIATATDIFGREGFAGTSTRDIATAAGVNTPAIQYYFCGKLGLYNACIDQLTNRVWRRIGPAVERCQAGAGVHTDLDELIAALAEVQDCLIDAFFSDDEGEAIRRLMTWEDAENGENTSEQLMKERIGLPIFESFRKVVERVVGSDIDSVVIDMHALSLMGLSMIFHFSQSKVMNMVSWCPLDEGVLATLKKVANTQLAYALQGLDATGAGARVARSAGPSSVL